MLQIQHLVFDAKSEPAMGPAPCGKTADTFGLSTHGHLQNPIFIARPPKTTMQFEHVNIASIGCCLPEESVSSSEIEQRLAPLYRRLRLPEGRLALMSGIEERRFWKRGSLPSDHSIRSVAAALDAGGIARDSIGALFHGSVCRDRLEPATASRVHALTGLSVDCTIFDLSNACLGILNGMLQVATMIELGQIDAGLVVGSEGSRELVETTIDTLNADTTLTRKSIKPAIASLTIGSASCAIMLAHRRLAPNRPRLRHAVVRAFTEHHALCQSGADEAVASGMNPLMETDAEKLMHEGVGAAQQTFAELVRVSEWNLETIDQSICHQVGSAHRKLLLESLGLEPARDFTTFEWLGNTGSAALPTTLAVAAEQQQLTDGGSVALLGIGSGLNVVMLGLDWASVPCQIEGQIGLTMAHPARFDRAHNAADAQPPTTRPTMSRSK